MGKYAPEDIDPSLCTHVVYAFALLDETELVIKPYDTFVDSVFYKKITALKRHGIKVTIGIGGWNDSLDGFVISFPIDFFFMSTLSCRKNIFSNFSPIFLNLDVQVSIVNWSTVPLLVPNSSGTLSNSLSNTTLTVLI